jgi:CheY-like chemotaxis protein
MVLQGSEETTSAQMPKEKSPNKDGPIDLLESLSHELRTPMNTILGFASLLKDHSLSEKDHDQFLNRIIVNGDHLLQILDDAFKFSKIAKGELEIEKVPFNISDMVYDISQTMKSAAEKKDLRIHITFKTPIPQTIQSDPLKARQILTNLFGNAIRQAGGDGFILVSLYLQDATPGGPEIVIELDDSGSGIAQNDNLSASQKLDQLEISFNESSDSLRPGFSLAQKFAEVLGGNLAIKRSELGSGFSMSLSLPTGDLTNVVFLNKKKSLSFTEKISNTFKKSHRLEGVRILLAEDSEDNATVIRLYLTKEGAKLTYVRNGQEAIEAVRSGDFDILLMDIQMPLLDGLEATRQIRQLGFKMPIIALTAHALRDDAEKSLKAGCDTHITKPVLKEPLIAEIEKRTVRQLPH